MKWLLLGLSVVSIALTIAAWRWKTNAKHIPFSAISKLFEGGLDHLSLQEQQAFRTRYDPWRLGGIGEFVIIFALVSVYLLIATARAFLE